MMSNSVRMQEGCAGEYAPAVCIRGKCRCSRSAWWTGLTYRDRVNPNSTRLACAAHSRLW